MNGKDLKEFISKIEILYGIACKYGASHRFPDTKLYREEKRYQKIVGNYDYRVDKQVDRKWETDTFKSFSQSRGESDTFNQGEFTTHKLVINPVLEEQSKKIPFIDVNRLLGEDHVFADEREILIPPFQVLNVDRNASWIVREGTKTGDPINDYGLQITPNMGCENGYSERKYGITDCEFDLIVSLYKKEELTPEEVETMKKLKTKLQNYIKTRCVTQKKLFMDNVLLAGNKISREGMRNYNDYIKIALDCTSPKKRSELIITKEDVTKNDKYGMNFGSSYRSSCDITDKYGVEVMQEGEPITTEIVRGILESNSRTGNAELTKYLATKGLLMDDVLSVGNQYTSKGAEYAGYLKIRLETTPKARRDNEIVTVAEAEKFLSKMGFGSDLGSGSYELVKMGLTRICDDPKERFDSAVSGVCAGAISSDLKVFLDMTKGKETTQNQGQTLGG